MNHIFRLIWSSPRKCFIVASETAKARGRKSKATAGGNVSIGALAVAVGSLFALPSAYAQISIVAENPGIVNSTATFSSQTIVDFNLLGTGANASTALGGIGSVAGGNIVNIDQYGGAPSQTLGVWSRSGRYITTGNGGSLSPVTITLTTPQNYFGLWVSAINSGNLVQIYSGTTLLKQFDAAALNTLLAGGTYLGNAAALASENGGVVFNGGENFAFVNFYGLSTTTFDKIVLSGSGFESDNFTVGIYSAQGVGGASVPMPDIVVAGNSNGTNLASSILSNGTSSNFNNRFDGGTLLMDGPSNTSYAGNFSITSNGAIIDQNGRNSTFTGVFSDDTPGTPGNLTIANSGTPGAGSVILTNTNTYTGTTTINNGATLALSGNAASIATSSAVINNGTFDLTNAATTVALGGSYTQGNTGNLKLSASAPATFQQLNVGGNANLNGTLTLVANPGSYTLGGRYTLINAGAVSGQFSTFSTNLSSYTRLGYQLGYSGTQVYLTLTPNAGDTLQGVSLNAGNVRSQINGQNAALLAGLSYDCSIFDKNNVCVSTGGRYTYAGEGSLSNLGGLVILGYRPSSNTRVGVFADQSLDTSSSNQIKLRKDDPTWGLFGHWAKNPDGNGLNVHASAVFSSSDITISRAASTSTEGGKGNSAFYGQAYELRASYVHPLDDKLTLSPYVGWRYSRITRGAYTEEASAQVANPVSYNSMSQEMTSAILGADLSMRVTDKVKASAGLGIQQNLNYRMDAYSGSSSIPGLASFSVPMSKSADTLAMVNASASYDISPRERLAISGYWQEQPSARGGTTSIVATWTLGF